MSEVVSMVERVARAMVAELCAQDGYDDEWVLKDGKLPYLDQSDVDIFKVARAAIEAMLSPTDPMIDAMYDADNDGEVEHAYRSALLAALNEQVAG